MKKQAFNPYLPSYEYVPDGEPRLFGNRVYIYGSHDAFDRTVFCPGDYVCWSASIDDLSNWKYEGVIYTKTSEPFNSDGRMRLFAPDVIQGKDGRYYLYYVLHKASVVSVAVCNTPAGKYQFYGYVSDKDGKRLGERTGDQPQFDPGVMMENDKVYLYTGFCERGNKSKKGAMATVLEANMLTIREEPIIVAPSIEYGKGSSFEGHEFFEASSIRKHKDTYFFIYSSIAGHELCYATSKNPTHGFTYKGVIVSNCDLHIDTYKPADRPMAYGANNHGSILEINGEWFIFYHRHTNATWFSRQGCAEQITILDNETIAQVEITSCGLNRGPLIGEGYYPAYIACNLYAKTPAIYVSESPSDTSGTEYIPRIKQDGCDGTEVDGYIANMTDGATAGFKYFLCKGVTHLEIQTRGSAKGSFQVRTTWNGNVLAEISIQDSMAWITNRASIKIPDGKQAIYLTYKGSGSTSLKGFSISAK